MADLSGLGVSVTKQETYDSLRRRLSMKPSNLGPGGKEHVEVLIYAAVDLGVINPETLNKHELLEACLKASGNPKAYSSDCISEGGSVTHKGLELLLEALGPDPSPINNRVEGRFTNYQKLEVSWHAQARETAEALAEFIDNSYSAFHTRQHVQEHNNRSYPTVNIAHGGKWLMISDDAGGMSEEELLMAMEPGSSNSAAQSIGLSGFGFGLKQAAAWFVGSEAWTIETCAIGSNQVVKLCKEPTNINDVRPTYERSIRNLLSNESAGFTKIRFDFEDENGLRGRIDDELQSPSYWKAVATHLGYIYSRLLSPTRVVRDETGNVTRENIGRRLAINWNYSGKTKNQNIPILPEVDDFALIDASESFADGFEGKWLLVTDVKHTTSQNVSISVPALIGATPDQQVQKGYRDAVGQVHRKFSRGLRLYYNDRLIAVVDSRNPIAVELCGPEGSMSAKRILAELDLDILVIHYPEMISAQKNQVNLAGNSGVCLKEIAACLKTASQKQILNQKPAQCRNLYEKLSSQVGVKAKTRKTPPAVTGPGGSTGISSPISPISTIVSVSTIPTGGTIIVDNPLPENGTYIYSVLRDHPQIDELSFSGIISLKVKPEGVEVTFKDNKTQEGYNHVFSFSERDQLLAAALSCIVSADQRELGGIGVILASVDHVMVKPV